MITYPNAVDERGIVHNIGTITKQNRADHKFYCLGCGKEMVPVLSHNRGPHFRHKVNDLCNPETYLHNLAKKYLAHLFETRQKFPVSYYATNVCPKKDSCRLFHRFHWKECFSNTKLYTFDLKERYDTCQIEGSFDGYRADVLLTNSKNAKIQPVFLEVSVSHDCTPEKLASGNLIIEMKVGCEADLMRPIIEDKGSMVPVKEDPKSLSYINGSWGYPEQESPFVKFHNFERKFHRDDLRRLDRFVLFPDGRGLYREACVSCGEMDIKHYREALLEVNRITQSKDQKTKQKYSLYQIGMAYALLRDLPVRHCEFCTHYQDCLIIKRQVIQSQLRARNNKDSSINLSGLASSCNYWQLNIVLCNRITNASGAVFVWERSKPTEENL